MRRRLLGTVGLRVSEAAHQTWNAYDVEAWPTTLLLDKQGRSRWMRVGEGDEDETEQLIQNLLAERGT